MTRAASPSTAPLARIALAASAFALGVVPALAGCAQSATAAEPTPAPAATAASAPLPASPAPTHARLEISEALEQSCREICDRSRRLNCENLSKCLPNCLAMGSATPCSGPINSFYRCLVRQPLDRWECAPDGVAAIKPGFCDAEQEATVACMDARMQ